MGKLVIDSVAYFGDNYFFQSPKLDADVNIIEGENGNGKTTFMNLIYYCLGGSVKSFSANSISDKHPEITGDTNNFVELNISILSKKYLLRRSIGKNFITISDEKGEVESYSISRNESPKIFSDWILTKLGVSILDVYQGTKGFKLNIKDLMRLIYHDQNPDPNKVYKKPDEESFISDSEYIRKLIFRVLLGKSFEEYYKSIGKLKKLEEEKKVAHSLCKEYESLSNNLYKSDDEILNIEHLVEKIEDIDIQLLKLDEVRKTLKNNRPVENESAWSSADIQKTELIQIELKIQELKDLLNSKKEELYKFKKYREGVIKEVTQLNKIIHTHEKLGIFDSNSCPFCLGELERKEGECYCGNVVNEETFERFFFNSDEYWSLLKSRKKSIETVDAVIENSEIETEKISEQLSVKEAEATALKENIRNSLSKITSINIDVDKINLVDDKSLALKNELFKLNEKLNFEKKLKHYNDQFFSKENRYKDFEETVKLLDLKSNREMKKTIRNFNKVYNELMTSTLRDCRSAMLDSDSYYPIIDGGEYREASSKVSMRFNYYLAILKLSIIDSQIKFPNFLMIDTPQTAGIDRDKLKKLIEQLSSLKKDSFQVILTTGHGLYPDELKNRVKISLTDDDKLLKKRLA